MDQSKLNMDIENEKNGYEDNTKKKSKNKRQIVKLLFI